MSEISSIGGSYQAAAVNYSSTETKAAEKAEESKVKETPAAVYEPSEEGKAAAAEADKSALIAQLKADSEARVQQMVDLVTKMFKQQGTAIANSDDMWKLLADGKLEVDPETRAQAQKDIAEDGYWGVEQTSQRIFDFAKALSGGDPEKMEKMRSAFEEGFAKATETWGKELPELSQRTYDAIEKLFDDYAASFKKEDE